LTEPIETKASVRSERTILVAVILDGGDDEAFDGLAELESLAVTAGAKIVATMVQQRRRPNAAYYIGKGKAGQLADLAAERQAEIVIFDNDLTAAQIRDLEDVVRCRVLDRSELILDIFATRAATRQARLQVQLAQLQYTYPRLRHMWTHLERIAGAAGGGSIGAVGGIGTRGPGETQIETDRRLVRRQIDVLKKQLKSIDNRKLRELKGRRDSFTVSLVGYTNAGKSTLLNKLTGADVYVEDKLFATLDTRTRRWDLGQGRVALLSDTVGFVKNLPHHLVASFKATLEETIHADLLIHVVDAASGRVEQEISTVRSVLEDLKCQDKNVVTVFNKIDKLTDEAVLQIPRRMCPGGLAVSAVSGEGLDSLTERICRYYHQPAVHLTLEVDYSAGKLLAFLQKHAEILDQQYSDHKSRLELTISRSWIGPMMKYDGVMSVLNCSDDELFEEISRRRTVAG